ncbi:MAG TPA: uracil phosphoribosyltransferase [Cyanobacteria bacterium UBA9971]|nr:uracil phosphoribosyltransferase [Cyanobacteria bacterium UBA9971]
MELSINKTKKLIVCTHPLISNNLAILRNKNTPSENFRRAVQKIAHVLFYKATKNLPVSTTSIETPLMTLQAEIIAPDAEIIIAPILRAGLIFSDAALEILPQARIHHIGLYRDEETLKPVPYYNNLPASFKSPERTFIYLLDPMLATGGSAIAAVKMFTEMNIPQENITFVSLISSPEGIKRLTTKYDSINIVTASVDSGLNEIGYILPGLGDAGDRAFNTNY